MILLGGFVLSAHSGWVFPRFATLITAGPFILGGVIGVVALWFRAPRIILACALVVLTQMILTHFTPLPARAENLGAGVIYPALTIIFPAAMIIFSTQARGRIFTVGALWRGALVTGALGVAIGIEIEIGDTAGLPIKNVEALLNAKFLPPFFDAWTVLPQPALVAFALAGAWLCVRAAMNRHVAEAAMGIALIAAVGAFHQVGHPPREDILWSSALAILGIGLIQDSHAMAFIDELTGLAGRRALTMDMNAMGGRYAAAMLDVDHFKKFNDTYGHDTGDQVLKMVASKMAAVGGGGRAYRYGGEEFTVLFPASRAADARRHLEAVRTAIAETPFRIRAQNRPKKKPGATTKQKKKKSADRNVTVSISIGLAHRGGGAQTPQDVLKRADTALYRAKKTGRNRLCV
ncbi:diguanylate cyclase (GGDEF)-like protein [Varunaivibrio sulfuroxidans]|uniref:diguanylate cyclase n=2 Tax=Varunaivibrio sulfuroxidans TaxID=1773489 RepID=A0A4R3J9E8_9PROT|nr:diguanylate cyclase (GGDEF)-like protein [Varunaivibrio sulfuroxidans]